MPSSARRALSLGIILAALISCDGAPPARPRLVVLYATCSVNRFFLSPYAPDIAFTPHLERFKNESVTFVRHHTEAGQSGIAFASIFSGTQAPAHSIYAHPKRLPRKLTLITEAFAKGGYDVFSWITHGMASPKLGYAQGVPRKHRSRGHLRASRNKRFQAILDQLERDPEYRAFIVLNFTVTHGPYGQAALTRLKHLDHLQRFCRKYPAECELRAADPKAFERNRGTYYHLANRLQYDFDETIRNLDLSDEEVSTLSNTIELLYKPGIYHLDELFGELVNAVRARGLYDESVIAFTSDHGEIMRRDHGFFNWSHGYQQAPEVIGVPLMIHAPGVAARTYAGVTRSIDVFPTLAGLSGVPIPDTPGIGENLADQLRSGDERRDLLAFSHSSVLPHMIVEGGDLPAMKNFGSLFPRRDPHLMWVSVRSGDTFYKLRRLSDAGFTPAVFDLANDMEESTNLYDPDDAEQAKMFAKLEDYRRLLIAGYASWEGQGESMPKREQTELLRSLGYIE
jgi:arylsulfatase A-like enzyme